MITHATQTDRAAGWLAEYLANSPGRTADASEVYAAAAEFGFDRYVLRRARQRLGVKIQTGSQPGRAYVSYWLFPARQPFPLTEAERAEAERLVAAVALGDHVKAFEVLGQVRPARVAVTLAVVVCELRSPSGGTETSTPVEMPGDPSEVAEDPTGGRP